MRLLLQQMYLSSAAWAEESNSIALTDLRESSRLIDKPLLHQHLDHYLKVMGEFLDLSLIHLDMLCPF